MDDCWMTLRTSSSVSESAPTSIQGGATGCGSPNRQLYRSFRHTQCFLVGISDEMKQLAGIFQSGTMFHLRSRLRQPDPAIQAQACSDFTSRCQPGWTGVGQEGTEDQQKSSVSQRRVRLQITRPSECKVFLISGQCSFIFVEGTIPAFQPVHFERFIDESDQTAYRNLTDAAQWASSVHRRTWTD